MADRLVAPPPEGAGLSEQQARRWRLALAGDDDDADVVDQRVLAWRAAGLPAEPPDELGSLVDDGLAPAAAAEFLRAGFDLPAVALLAHVPLTVSVRWRAEGLTPGQTWDVVRADPELTPQELAAFDAEGVGWPDRVAWIGYGFDAATAREWLELGLRPTRARLWRSVGLGPADAAAHLAARGDDMPPDLQAGWFSYGPEPSEREYGVVDPPGTRGRAASEPPDLRDYLRWRP